MQEVIPSEALRQDPRRRRVRRLARPRDLTRVGAPLLRELAACATALADGNGRRPAGVSVALLRSLVIAVRDRAGPAWLDASAGGESLDTAEGAAGVLTLVIPLR